MYGFPAFWRRSHYTRTHTHYTLTLFIFTSPSPRTGWKAITQKRSKSKLLDAKKNHHLESSQSNPLLFAFTFVKVFFFFSKNTPNNIDVNTTEVWFKPDWDSNGGHVLIWTQITCIRIFSSEMNMMMRMALIREKISSTQNHAVLVAWLCNSSGIRVLPIKSVKIGKTSVHRTAMAGWSN